jgi:hypothetical protein
MCGHTAALHEYAAQSVWDMNETQSYLVVSSVPAVVMW